MARNTLTPNQLARRVGSYGNTIIACIKRGQIEAYEDPEWTPGPWPRWEIDEAEAARVEAAWPLNTGAAGGAASERRPVWLSAGPHPCREIDGSLGNPFWEPGDGW